MALSKGRRNPPLCTMSLFLSASITCLSATLRNADLYLLSLRVLQPDKRLFPFSIFYTHSLIQFTISLLQLVMRALRNLGSAVKGVVIRLHTLHRLYRSTRLVDILPGICWFETANRHPCPVSNLRWGNRGVCVSHPGSRYWTQDYLRVHLIGQVHKLLLISDVC